MQNEDDKLVTQCDCGANLRYTPSQDTRIVCCPKCGVNVQLEAAGKPVIRPPTVKNRAVDERSVLRSPSQESNAEIPGAILNLNTTVDSIFVLHGEKKLGPFSRGQLLKLLASGKINPSTLIWFEGLEQWLPLKSVVQRQTESETQLPPIVPRTHVHDAYFNVPVWRLIVMWFASCTVFEFLWMYRNWDYLKRRDRLSIAPQWRAFFDIFFFLPLLKHMQRDHFASKSKIAFPSTELVGYTFVLLKVLSWLSQMAARQTEGIPRVLFIVLAVLLTLPTILCLVRIQLYIRALNVEINRTFEHSPWSPGHTITLGVGAMVWIGLLFAILESSV